MSSSFIVEWTLELSIYDIRFDLGMTSVEVVAKQRFTDFVILSSLKSEAKLIGFLMSN